MKKFARLLSKKQVCTLLILTLLVIGVGTSWVINRIDKNTNIEGTYDHQLSESLVGLKVATQLKITSHHRVTLRTISDSPEVGIFGIQAGDQVSGTYRVTNVWTGQMEITIQTLKFKGFWDDSHKHLILSTSEGNIGIYTKAHQKKTTPQMSGSYRYKPASSDAYPQNSKIVFAGNQAKFVNKNGQIDFSCEYVIRKGLVYIGEYGIVKITNPSPVKGLELTFEDAMKRTWLL